MDKSKMHWSERELFMCLSLYSSVYSPLDQFEIRNLLSFEAPILGNLQLPITNIALYLTIATFTIITLNVFATNYNRIVCNS